MANIYMICLANHLVALRDLLRPKLTLNDREAIDATSRWLIEGYKPKVTLASTKP
jgi:hypothetical protein